MSPVRQVALGFAFCFAALGAAIVACGPSTQSLPALVRCQLGALKILPRDPMQATVQDAVDIVRRLESCRAEHPDGGAP